MGLLDLFKRRQPTASVAKERLQILVSHERAARNAPSWLPDLKNDILEVVKKYAKVDPADIEVNVEHDQNRELLELNITLPEQKQA
jgi:cell division topological specificity factor